MRSKKLHALEISFALFCSFTVAGVTGAQKPDLDHPIQPKSVVKKEFVPTDPEDFIKKNGLRKPSKDAVLVKVVDVDYVYENDPSAGETVTHWK